LHLLKTQHAWHTNNSATGGTGGGAGAFGSGGAAGNGRGNNIFATPTVSVSDAGGTYNGNPFPASATVTGISGPPDSTLEGVSLTLTYYSGTYTLNNPPSSGGSSTAPAQAGSYTVVACFAGSTDYSAARALADFSIGKAPLTITANDASRYYGQGNPTFSVRYSSFVAGEGPSVLSGTLSVGTPALPSSAPGTYPLTPNGLSSSNYTITFLSGTLTVLPAPLSATGQTITPTAGAPFSGVVATFTSADPYGSAASYTAMINWGDGSTSTGTITGTGMFTVSGSHTYANPASETVRVTISHNLGDTTTATTTSTATVKSLGLSVQVGQSAGFLFWAGRGQALIMSFNGGSTATGLANWLALTFPKLYGAQAGVHNLFGQSNAQVAAFYQTLLSSSVLDAEVLATALNVYATTQSLGSTTGQAYGFTVSATGLGADSFNVLSSGAAFGVANSTTLNVYQLLLAANQRAVNGVLYNGDMSLRLSAQLVFDALNSAGGVS
jgi:hypothetical protein